MIILGGSRTVIRKEQLRTLVPYRAVAVTTFVPLLKVNPEGGELVTEAPAVANGGLYVTTADVAPELAITIMFVGQ